MTAAGTADRRADSYDRDPHQRTLLWKLLQSLFRILTSVLFDLKVHGKQHIPKTGGVLVVANHQSYLDPILLAVQLRRPVSFMAKSELFHNRLFGAIIRRLNAFPVQQSGNATSAIKESVRRLQQGHMLVIYPEGSRCEDGELQPIEQGAALVVRRATGVTVVPAVIEGSFDAWPKWRPLFRPARIEVLYGPPLQVEGLKATEITDLIDKTFHRMFAELRQRMGRANPPHAQGAGRQPDRQ